LVESLYSEMCQGLRESDKPLNVLFNTEPLSSRSAEIPSDREFRYTLQQIEIETVTPQWRQLLSRLYYEAGPKETKPEGPHQVHVDHILPKSPTPAVYRESGITDRDEAAELIGRIGNLALLSGEKNILASNSAFSQKREHYASSDLLLTRRLDQYDKWGKEQIEARSKELADLAVRVYPHPLEIANEGS
jgi:hypothetical protein